MPYAHPGVVRTRRGPRNHPRGCLQTPGGCSASRGPRNHPRGCCETPRGQVLRTGCNGVYF
nr:MAG TPA: hypothetical protein [Caudoviricetes sp.]DAN74461.1 MAG TPA: hypothetical protein [Caudoviricetes sp.]